ncbi:hypothetical protein BKA80DRAFT_120217 [Phyllosticta citrichinensis]
MQLARLTSWCSLGGSVKTKELRIRRKTCTMFNPVQTSRRWGTRRGLSSICMTGSSRAVCSVASFWHQTSLGEHAGKFCADMAISSRRASQGRKGSQLWKGSSRFKWDSIGGPEHKGAQKPLKSKRRRNGVTALGETSLRPEIGKSELRIDVRSSQRRQPSLRDVLILDCGEEKVRV